jgi:RimJ/RimL family protein N-acetyltransferase
MSIGTDVETENGWRLRVARLDDIAGLHALASMPLVYRYLFDGAAPDREFIARRVAQAIASPPASGYGLWILQGDTTRCAGCVELRPYPAPRSAELTYLLDTANWRQGLAVRMAWTAITQVFLSSPIDAIIAGADLPNSASFAVMRRLGMRFHKAVQYPLGNGEEYVLHRDDTGPMPRPAPISLR